MLKVYSLFKIQIQFDDDKLSELRIMCTCCNNFSHCCISKVKQSFFTKKEILPVFSKAGMFHHVGISRMYLIREQINFAADEHYGEWCTGGIWFIEKIFHHLHGTLCE